MHFGPAKNALFQSKMPKKFTKNVNQTFLGHLGLQIRAICDCNFIIMTSFYAIRKTFKYFFIKMLIFHEIS